ncbi:MAG TPA: 50S ribosomal protein L21 [Candidatus Paceibacterota bacterium]|jgi:large subunit ribosomal protein L21|nr:50S ribosomal protein L21 [Candidatus Paceibacterota bacterium]HPQ23256.1 50S ribosomal protein L21 [Candidatus Paceibacterota bacterium]
MFAVVKIGAKQYLVKPGQKIKIEKIKNKKEGEEVVFDQVLLLENEKGEIEIGQPYLENKTLKGKILETGRDKKVVVFRYHNKTRYRKKKGHRQEFMKVEILA